MILVRGRNREMIEKREKERKVSERQRKTESQRNKKMNFMFTICE